jgi:hypothetical protein
VGAELPAWASQTGDKAMLNGCTTRQEDDEDSSRRILHRHRRSRAPDDNHINVKSYQFASRPCELIWLTGCVSAFHYQILSLDVAQFV